MGNKKEMTWIKIDRDENGFATEKCLDKIFNNLPCAVCSQTCADSGEPIIIEEL